MASLLTPPPSIDLADNRVPPLLFANVFTFSLALIVVFLRFVSRRLSHLSFGWDDYLMLPAAASAAVLLFTDTVYMVNNGLGKHIYVAPNPAMAAERWAIGLFITEISYTITLVAVKLSILALYRRIFWGSRPFRIAVYVLTGVVIAWGVAFLLVTIFDCSPVSGAWTRFSMEAIMDPAKAPVCRVQAEPAYLSNSAINLATDIAMLILPLPMIWQLKLPKSQKLAMSAIFAIGLFDIAVAAARFVFIIQFEIQLLRSIDVTWTFVFTQIWSAVEVNTAVICACLASLRPLLNLILYGSVDRPGSQPTTSRSESRVNLAKDHKPKKHSGSYFEQRQSFSGSVKSWSSRTKGRFAESWSSRHFHGSNKTSSEVIIQGMKGKTMPPAELDTAPTTISRHGSVRKASLQTEEAIKESLEKGFDNAGKGFEVINVYTTIDLDGPSRSGRDMV